MSPFPKDIAGRIVRAYDELERSETLRADLIERIENVRQDGNEDLLRPPWNRGGIEMGVPTDRSGKRILQVLPETALLVLDQHVVDCQKRLAEATAEARQFFAGDTP